MDWKRTTTVGVSGGTVVALLATASSPTVHQSNALEAPTTAPATTRVDVVRVNLDRLRVHAAQGERLDARNPFAFVAAKSPGASSLPASALPEAAPEPPRSLPRPSWRLIGIATSPERSGAQTAILTGGGMLHFVGVGDVLPDGLRVTEIHEESVSLQSAEEPPVVLRMSHE